MLFRSTRLRRIDRALSHVLTAIDDESDATRRAMSGATWRDLDLLSIATDAKRKAAFDRADALETAWQRRVDAWVDE
jgi:hypothetical protein